MPITEDILVTLLVKLGVVASLASILTRISGVKRALLREVRTLGQTLRFGLWFSLIFGAGVLTRVATGSYLAGDLGLEGSLLSGILGGYVTGLLSGVLISLPAMIHGEYLTMPLLAAVGVMGGLLRDIASDPEDIWSFSPSISLSQDRRRTLFHLVFFAAILLAEFLRQGWRYASSQNFFSLCVRALAGRPRLKSTSLPSFPLFYRLKSGITPEMRVNCRNSSTC
jgi:two-component system LytT family sensor kinase